MIWLTGVSQVIGWHRNQTESIQNLCWGYEFTTFPGVFCPFVAPSGKLTLCFPGITDFRGRRILDIGCGSGILACVAALGGASSVVAVDINPLAIENTLYNAKKMKVSSKVDCRLGDVFGPIRKDEEFDIIFANLPFTNGEVADALDAAFYDPQLRSLNQYIEELPNWLRVQNSKAFLCFSNLEDNSLQLTAESRGLGWNQRLVVNEEWIELALIEL